jgi:hypothetical protein
MGGSLKRDKRHNDNSTGETVVDHQVPTMTLSGTKDGLFRITRGAESYFHLVQNIQPSQNGKNPVVLMDGLCH